MQKLKCLGSSFKFASKKLNSMTKIHNFQSISRNSSKFIKFALLPTLASTTYYFSSSFLTSKEEDDTETVIEIDLAAIDVRALRLAAGTIDFSLFVFFPLSIGSWLIHRLISGEIPRKVVTSFISSISYLLYNFRESWFGGQTSLGKSLFSLSICTSDGRFVSSWHCFARSVCKIPLQLMVTVGPLATWWAPGMLIGLDFISLALANRTTVDWIMGTSVVPSFKVHH